MLKTKRVSILLEIAIRWCVKQDSDIIISYNGPPTMDPQWVPQKWEMGEGIGIHLT